MKNSKWPLIFLSHKNVVLTVSRIFIIPSGNIKKIFFCLFWKYMNTEILVDRWFSYILLKNTDKFMNFMNSAKE